MYLIINIIFVIISIIVFIYSYSKDNIESNINNRVIDKYYKIFVIILLLIVIISSIYKLGIVPRGINVDEAGMFYDVINLYKNGCDRYLYKYPVYFINFGRGQSVMYGYLTLILMKIFGDYSILMRVVSVIFRIITFIMCYYIIKFDKNKLKRLIFLLLIAIVPYFIMASRFGLDCNLLVSFMVISITTLLYSIKKDSNILLFVSGIFFGLSLYTYALSYIIIPIFLLLCIIYLLYIKRINIKNIIILGIPIFILSIPLLLFILVNNNIINEINGFISIPKLPIYRESEISILNIFSNIKVILSLLSIDRITSGENLIFNSIPYFGTLYYISIPFLIIGMMDSIVSVISSIKRKVFSIDYIMFIWFLASIICLLIIKLPNINKGNAIYISLVYFVSCGIYSVINNNRKILFIILFLYLTNYLVFISFYYFKYNNVYDNPSYFATYYLDVLDYIEDKNYKYVYISPDIESEAYIYILLKYKLPYKKDYIKVNNTTYIFHIPSNIDSDSLYIIKEEDLYKYSNVSKKKFGNIYLLKKSTK